MSKQLSAVQITLSAEQHLLSRKDAARLLGVAAETLAVWKCTGRYNLPCVMVGRIPKYRLSDLNHWLTSRTIHSLPESTGKLA